MPKTRKAVVVGSTNFPLDAAVVAQVVDVIRGLGQGTTILTRGSEGLDTFIIAASMVLGMRCLTYKSDGGSLNWNRDVELVRDSTEVHGFLSLEDFERTDKMSGTMHILEKSLDQRKPTTLYTVSDGVLIQVGWSE
jgi:hypothetical protein